ncbi:hypothetical protein V6N11_081177 [Hibiscus sabdariffa]|uniref:Uncharacterized protein n=1 Tax=Hibiscus sabdariffa TaxID=183260 RepID=A0ABR2QJ27_9ROSI
MLGRGGIVAAATLGKVGKLGMLGSGGSTPVFGIADINSGPTQILLSFGWLSDIQYLWKALKLNYDNVNKLGFVRHCPEEAGP